MAGRTKREGPVNYFELPRKQLQSLCKKYGFPANKTNQLMAEFLTCHLNSDTYLDRDESQRSPALKTKVQCRYEKPTTDDNLPTTSESKPEVAETDSKRLSHEFTNSDAAQSDRPLEASKAAGTGLGQVNQINSEDVVPAGFPIEEAVYLGTSGFRIRDACLQYQRESAQETPLPTTDEAMDITKGCETDCPSRASITGSGSGDLLEEAMNSSTTGFGYQNFSIKSQESQETPLPLSVMPYVRLVTPDNVASSEIGVKLFVDLISDGLSPGDNPRDYYQALEASLTWNVTKTQDEIVWRSLKAEERSERKLPVLEDDTNDIVSKADRTAEDQEGTKNLLLEAAVVSTSCKKDAGPLKSCLLTPTRKPCPPSVSFLCPPIFSSPRSIRSMALDSERSVIVKEWSVEQTQETIQPIDVIACADEDKAVNGELVLRNLGEVCFFLLYYGRLDRWYLDTFWARVEFARPFMQNLLAKQPAELNTRTLPPTADMDSPPIGIVPTAVKIYEEQLSRPRGPSSIKRKDSYKGSPFLKSSRIAAELERTSKLGQTRRVGILALKRAIGVASLFSDTQEDVEKAPQDSPSSSPAEAIVVSKANTSSIPLQSPDNMVIQLEGISVTGGVSSSDMDIVTQTKPFVANDALQNEVTTLSTFEDADEKDERTIVETDTSSDNVKGNEAPVVADEATNLSVNVKQSAANLTWMTKPIQVPARRHLQHKEKPVRPFSANGRTLKLMETASAKLKMLKKSTVIKGEAISDPKKSSRTSADRKGVEIRGCAEEVELPGEVKMTEKAAELGVPRLQNDVHGQSEMVVFTGSKVAEDVVEDEKRKGSACEEVEPSVEVKMSKDAEGNVVATLENEVHSISPSSQSKFEDSMGSKEAEEGNSPVVGDEKRQEIDCESFIKEGIDETGAELNIQKRPDTAKSVSTESQSASKGSSKSDETTAEKPSLPLSFLDIDFSKMKVQNLGGGPPPRIELEIDCKVREQIAADNKSILSPLDGNRLAKADMVDSCPYPTTPTKFGGILDAVVEVEEKNNGNGLSLCGKENEWSRRQEQHKTPLTGRSKEKSLRTAEKKASNLREQLLKKRRGMMMEGQIDVSDSLGIDLSPLKQLATNRLL